MSGQQQPQQPQQRGQQHHDALRACCDDPDCANALDSAKRTVEAAGFDWAAFLRKALTVIAQVLPQMLTDQQAMKAHK